MSKRMRWRVTAVSAAILLSGCNVRSDHEDDSRPTKEDLRTFEQAKADMKAKIEASGLTLPEPMFCTARAVSDQTVETMYRLFLYERGDLTNDADREAATADVLGTFENTCGGDIVAMANELQRDGSDTVHKGFVLAMLKEGR